MKPRLSYTLHWLLVLSVLLSAAPAAIGSHDVAGPDRVASVEAAHMTHDGAAPAKEHSQFLESDCESGGHGHCAVCTVLVTDGLDVAYVANSTRGVPTAARLPELHLDFPLPPPRPLRA